MGIDPTTPSTKNIGPVRDPKQFGEGLQGYCIIMLMIVLMMMLIMMVMLLMMMMMRMVKY